MAPPIERLLRRERVLVLLCLAGVVALAWLYLFDMAGHLAMGHPMSPIDRPWGSADLLATAVMWIVMMVGMMLPSAAPVVLLYALVDAQSRSAAGAPEARGALLLAGYLAAWVGFSVAATLLQWQLAERVLLDPELRAASPTLAGALFIVAGLYEFTPLKRRCLSHCRSPLDFVTRRYRSGGAGAFRMGVEHGVYCLGCCWALMLLLFAVGVMNLAWVALLAALAMAEKYWRHGVLLSRLCGVLLAAAGAAMIAGIA
jgi:predicted metal-binding membrane protein